jgi:hypothetical protein
MKRWAWEYLRRNQDYQKDADMLTSLSLAWQLRLSRPNADDFKKSPETTAAALLVARRLLRLLHTGSSKNQPFDDVRLSPLRIFRQKWSVLHPYAHSASYDDISKNRPLTATERTELASCSKLRRKTFPKFRLQSIDPSSFTHSGLKDEDRANATSYVDKKVHLYVGQTRRLRVMPNEGVYRFYFNGSIKHQLKQAEKWFKEKREAYDGLLALVSPSPRALDTNGVEKKVHVKMLRLRLRVYDAAVERNAQHSLSLDTKLCSEILSVMSPKHGGSEEEFEVKKLTVEVIRSQFAHAKHFVEKGGHVVVARRLSAENDASEKPPR